jgi:hypothetical protein
MVAVVLVVVGDGDGSCFFGAVERSCGEVTRWRRMDGAG